MNIATSPPPLDDHLCLAVYKTGMSIQRLYKPVLDDLGITYPQYLVLNLLWAKEPQSVGNLAAELDLESSTVTPLLKRLEAMGHVMRGRNPMNERQVLVRLTEQGRDLRNHAGAVTDALIQKAGLDKAELDGLNRALRNLDEVIKA